jgi:hypothetical protein
MHPPHASTPHASTSRARPRWPAPLAGLAALGLYARTLAPGLTWAHHAADGGDLLAAALTLGVPHPSGYPTYQLLLRAAIAIFPGEPARAGNWLSALCAAAAVALFADLAGRMLAQIVSRADGHAAGDAAADRNVGQVANLSYEPISGAATPMLSGLVALAAALTWAASPIFWGQAVVTEVYALNALAVVALLWLLWRWREAVDVGAPGWPWLAGAGAALGLGLGNHLTLLLMLPGAAIWLWAGRQPAGRSLARGLLAALIAAAAGLAVYGYLPLVAAANPPVNWGDPRRLAQLWTLVSGQVYRGLVFGLPVAYLPERLAAWSGEALRQFGGPWGVILALIGLWRLDRQLHAWWQATLLTAAAYSVYAIGYNTPDSFVYLIPTWCVAALWLAAGLDWLPGVIARCNVVGPLRGTLPTIFRATLIALLLAVPAISVVRFWRENDLSHDRQAQEFVSRTLVDAAPDAIILTSSDGPTFALWYVVYGLGQRPDVAPVNVNLVSFDWYRRTLAEHHPEFAAALSAFDPAQPVASLTAMAAQRPLYRAETLSVLLPGYDERPEGSLVRLTRHVDE